MSIDSVAEYLLFLQLYDQYKLDCVRKGKTPNGLPVFLSNLKDAQRVTVSADVAVSGLVNTDSPFKSCGTFQEMNSHSTEANERRRKRALTMRKSLMASSSITEVKGNSQQLH
ncbi:hypothetical protein OUZ56_026844 [Daphnia magna]|uniref:Uncharacterized protein n=1 Tax=Daphnia magna TaxID=35525 RepID=A0ABQ9ZNC6_9CRUS|nr:hypothetical protein OUZ56_026844 [Daphnia magna]